MMIFRQLKIKMRPYAFPMPFNENVAQSSVVAREITQNVSEVNQAAVEIAASSSRVKMSADELSKLAERLNAMVGRFKI